MTERSIRLATRILVRMIGFASSLRVGLAGFRRLALGGARGLVRLARSLVLAYILLLGTSLTQEKRIHSRLS